MQDKRLRSAKHVQQDREYTDDYGNSSTDDGSGEELHAFKVVGVVAGSLNGFAGDSTVAAIVKVVQNVSYDTDVVYREYAAHAHRTKVRASFCEFVRNCDPRSARNRYATCENAELG